MTNKFGEVKKLTEIEKLANSSSQNIDRLLELSHDNDSEVRHNSIEAFENFEPTEAILIRVREGLADEDDLVRTMSIELLGDWEDTHSTDNLKLALTDDSEIVRTAAILSLGQIGSEDSVKFLEERFPDFEEPEKVSASMALYLLGRKEYLDDLLSLLDDDFYRIRCAVANLIRRFINDEDKAKVLEKMKLALAKEETVAATSSLSNAIAELEDN